MLVPKTRGYSNKPPKKTIWGPKPSSAKLCCWIIPSLISILGCAGDGHEFIYYIGEPIKRLSSHSEARLLNFLVLVHYQVRREH